MKIISTNTFLSIQPLHLIAAWAKEDLLELWITKAKEILTIYLLRFSISDSCLCNFRDLSDADYHSS